MLDTHALVPVDEEEREDDLAPEEMDDGEEAAMREREKIAQERFRLAQGEIGRERLNAAMRAIAATLQSEATRRVGLRQSIEERWIDDLEQLHSRYPAATEKILSDDDRSRVFVNMTMHKTNAMGSRMKDMLYPTDDRCWAIAPTPVPTLNKQADRAATKAQMKSQEAAAAQQQAQSAPPEQQQALQDRAGAAQQEANEAQEAWKVLNARIEEAKERARLMQEEIDDQLTECNYQAVKRDQIDWAMKIGTGVTKGPVTGDVVRKGWKDDGSGNYELDVAYGTQPAHRLVDPWGFFPDPDVANIADGNGVFERHLKNPHKLRELGRLTGFDKEALRRLLRTPPISNAPSYIASLRNIRGEAQAVTGPIYHVWEYNGPLDPDQIRELALALNHQTAWEMINEIDPLKEVHACVWFCENEVLKFQLYPLDSGEPLYSVFNLVKDEYSIFGYGMPAVLRDLQSIFNAAWRTLMDNAGISSGPQIVIDRTAVEPQDGDYTIKGRKLWESTKGITKENPPFQVFNIPSMANELLAIMAASERLIDVVSMMPAIAQGEQGAGITKTAQGMALLMNSTNVVFRNAIKNFDDDVTVPDIRRQYDWNMQFNDRQEIKGDYDVKATGSSVLLVREMQAQSLMTIALNFGGHPVFGPMLNNRALLKKIFQAHMIPADEIMLSDEQIDAIIAQAAAAAEKGDGEVQKLQLQHQLEMERMDKEHDLAMALANMEGDYKLRIAKYTRDTTMMQLAAKGNENLEQIRAQLEIASMESGLKERLFAAEAAVTAKQPPQQPTGGGNF